MTILETALASHERDLSQRRKACERLREVHEQSEAILVELKEARGVRAAVLESNWMPGDPGEDPKRAYDTLTSRIETLEKLVGDTDTTANQIFYGKA